MVNQKKRAIAFRMLVKVAMRFCSSGIPATISTAVCAHWPKWTRVSANFRVGVHGHVAGYVVEDVGFRRDSRENRRGRMVTVVGKIRLRRQSKNAKAGT